MLEKLDISLNHCIFAHVLIGAVPNMEEKIQVT